jgi:hypothetical protein
MKTSSLIVMFVFLSTVSFAKIYKWVDESGSINFSDRPSSEEAQEVNINSTGIEMHKTEEDIEREKKETQQKKSIQTKKPAAEKVKPVKEAQKKEITEADYKISSSVGKLGSDAISISGRIGSGPICLDISVTAKASTETGLSGTITDQVSKKRSHGSIIFAGATKVAGSAEDRGFWKVESVTIRCNDN